MPLVQKLARDSQAHTGWRVCPHTKMMSIIAHKMTCRWMVCCQASPQCKHCLFLNGVDTASISPETCQRVSDVYFLTVSLSHLCFSARLACWFSSSSVEVHRKQRWPSLTR